MNDELASVPAPAAPAAVLHAISWCLRALSCGYGLDPRERAAAIAILSAGIPGVDATDLETAAKFLRSSCRLSSRRREKASKLSVRLAEWVETLRCRT